MVTAAATPIVGGERKEQEREEGRSNMEMEPLFLHREPCLLMTFFLMASIASCLIMPGRQALPFNIHTFQVCDICKEPLLVLWFHTSPRCPCLPHAYTDQSAAWRGDQGTTARHVIRPATVEHLHVRVREPFNARRYVGAYVLLLHYDL